MWYINCPLGIIRAHYEQGIKVIRMRLYAVAVVIVLLCTCQIGYTKGLKRKVDQQSELVIYRGRGNCTVDIPNVQPFKLKIEVSFDKDIFDFDLISPSYPLFVLTIDGKNAWFNQPSSFRKVVLSNTYLMQQETDREIAFKYNFDKDNQPAITCSVKTVA